MTDEFTKNVSNWLNASSDSFTTGEIVPGEGATSYWEAPEVENIAKSLIQSHHEMLGKSGVRIAYLFRSDAPKRNGKIQEGITKKITGLNARLAGSDEPFFCIVLSRPVWEVLYPEHREALVDHELCHCGIEVDEKGDTKLILRHHDVQEFSQIVRRYGPWNVDLQDFLKAAFAEKRNPFPLLDGKSRSAGEK